ncbi:uncharacterized protein LOC132750380 [Ruditapes philippinarum]|uniref:uncharacterized protein LOC132750380 n=1 Tax=Ruditapes philippinarum TaxID=129788 RepID=UPI00295B4D0B|nr:uncharacterized protein LOC132750380 [Ruditapes philippinarum]
MYGSKHLILACLLAICSASHGNISQYLDTDDIPVGPLCYSCSYLTDPRTCGTQVRCGRDEICMLHELMPGADGSKRFTSHCETEIVCQNLRNHAKKSRTCFVI